MSDSVNTTLRKNALGVGAIVFLVLAAVAPLTGMVAVVSLAIALGDLGGSPFAFLAVAVALLLVAVGYGKMSSEVVNAGGFNTFVVKGLGRPAGIGYALYLRRSKQAVYDALASDLEGFDDYLRSSPVAV